LQPLLLTWDPLNNFPNSVSSWEQQDVEGLGGAFEDDTAIRFDHMDRADIKVEQPYLKAADIFPALLADEIAQFATFGPGELVLGATAVTAAAWNERQKTDAAHAISQAEPNYPWDHIQMASDNGGLHRRCYTGPDQALDGSNRLMKGGAPNHFVVMILITVKTYFDLRFPREQRGNEVVSQGDSVCRQFRFAALRAHVGDQFGQIVVDSWLSAAEMDRPYPSREEPVDPSLQGRGRWMNTSIGWREAKATARITKSRDAEADHRRQIQIGPQCHGGQGSVKMDGRSAHA